MNARYPYSGFDASATAGGDTPAHPDEALLREIAELRAENLRLRASQQSSPQNIGPLHSPPDAQQIARDELNRQIVASNPDCAKVLDLNGHVLQMTEQGCRLMEIDDFESVRNSDWTSWWPEEGQTQARTCIDEARQGNTTRFVGFGCTQKGSPRWWDTSISPIRGVRGTVDMLLAVSRDITESHLQQEEFRRLNNDLESRVAHRVQELALANQQIQSTLEDAQAIYNDAPCGYHSLDKQGVYLAVNDTELKWLGYRREDVIGKLSYRDITSPEHWAAVEGRLEKLVSDRPIESAEIEMVRRDGTTFPVIMSSSSVTDGHGNFLRSNTTVVDISHSKRAEVALEQNQRFLQTITDHVPGMIAYLDASLRFRFANAEHLVVYGMDPAKIVGMEISQCVPATVWADIQPRIQAALRGETQQFEAWRTRADGQAIFVSASYLPDILDGVVKGVFVQIIDITERKRIEERVTNLNDELEQLVKERSAELLESEQRFRLMVDTLREYSVFFLDASGLITDWTDSAQRMEGYSPSEMLGRHYATLFSRANPETGREKADRNLRLAASRGQHEIHNWHARKDGSRYWCHSLLIALRDARGDLKGFAKINRDMSDAKRLDDLMRNINEELENRVAERTEQLLAANKDLESFSYSVSHDLRSPLRHISSFVSLLEEHLGEQRDDISSRYLGTIGSSARHMSQLIDGLLAFSRLGRSAINLAPVDLSLLVGTVVAQLGHDTEGRIVDWVLAPDLPVVQGDALLLREVWANLLGNAYKYSRTRERTRIEVGWSVDPATGYTFFVRDNGVGFDTKYATKLFGVFQRLHRASEFEGTGIGLALTRRIVERHGGSIWADSQVGEGSVFHFSLPFEGLHAPESKRDSMFAELTL
jgi:PAS domain S-box-containing protein